jgi:hypothetical protein
MQRVQVSVAVNLHRFCRSRHSLHPTPRARSSSPTTSSPAAGDACFVPSPKRWCRSADAAGADQHLGRLSTRRMATRNVVTFAFARPDDPAVPFQPSPIGVEAMDAKARSFDPSQDR